MKRLNKKGFTLVELLAVIVILALLMVVAFNVVPNIQNNARETAMQTEAQKLSNQLVEDYNLYLINGSGVYSFSETTITNISAAQVIELTDNNYHMYAKFDGSKVTEYCIEDTNVHAAMLSSGDDGYQSPAKQCNKNASGVLSVIDYSATPESTSDSTPES